MFEIIANFGSENSLDFLVLAAFTGVFLLSLFFLPYGKIVNNVVSIYVAFALLEGVPFSRKLIEQINESRDPSYSVKMIMLGILITGVFVVVSWGVAQSGGHGSGHPKWLSGWWKVFLLGFAQAGLLISIVLTYLDTLLASQISWSIRKIFIGEIAKIIWFLLPIVLLIIASKLDKLDKKEASGGHKGDRGDRH